MTKIFGALIAFGATLGLASCNFDSSANTAHGCDSCAPGMCYLGYCLQPAPVTGAPGSGGAGPSGGSGSGSAAGQGGDNGASGTNAVGSNGGTGGASGNGGASGSCVPADETCNGGDDDCDGKADEDVMLGSCPGSGSSACGGVLQCEAGKPVCHASDTPAAEVCNGNDDDCDGKIDEDTDQTCYPDNTAGCTKDGDGTFTCVGACKQGVRECKAGTLAACVAFVVPVAEVCGEADAQDEDCDGKVDDDCPCQGNETQSCYTGPRLTRNVGTCKGGTQKCSNGVFGECKGSITPVDETCSNQLADDDCNHVIDDVPGAGFLCAGCLYASMQCRSGSLVCVKPTDVAVELFCDTLDDDCDGTADEGFDITTEDNCGGCGIVCGSQELCCDGLCKSTNTDDHCGSCAACASGAACCNRECLPNGPGTCDACHACEGALMCCDGMCRDTTTDERCGSCEHACAGDGCHCAGSSCQDSEGAECPLPP